MYFTIFLRSLESVVQTIPTGLFKAIYLVVGFGARGFPSILTSSPSTTRLPSCVAFPLMVTLPSIINFSASLLEQIPVALIYLLRLIES